MAGLVVVLGAGASYDCASTAVERDEGRQPPLVKDLFEPRKEFAVILNEYPLAEMAAAEIRLTLATEAIALEEYLRTRLRDAPDRYARFRYRQVPLYLQHLFWKIGQPAGGHYMVPGYTRQPDNYDALLNVTLQLERVLFVTLNYDTILDQRLAQYPGGLRNMDAYVAPDRNWGLFKLHGSVNWRRAVRARLSSDRVGMPTDEYLRSIGDSEEFELEDEIELHDGSLGAMRYDGGRTLYYPALSAPLGAEDEISCPASHIQNLQAGLRDLGPINLLVIGYSGLDREVLSLVQDSAVGMRSLLVANGSFEASFAAAEKFARACGLPGIREESAYTGGFSQLVSTGALREFVESLT